MIDWSRNCELKTYDEADIIADPLSEFATPVVQPMETMQQQDDAIQGILLPIYPRALETNFA